MVGGTLQAGTNGGLNVEVTDSGNHRVPLALINQGTADNSGVIISHRGKDDAGNQEDYCYIKMVADDTGSGSEDSSMRFWTIGGGTLGERLRILQEGSLRQTSTGSLQIAKGTTAQRPTGVAGMVRYNTTTSKLEYYDGSAWQSIRTTFEGSGGNSTYTFGGYKVHVFLSLIHI